MMAVRVGMPLVEFVRQYREKPFELINGEKYFRRPTDARHAETLHALLLALHEPFILQGGSVFCETTVLLPDGDDISWVTEALEPDVMCYVEGRIAASKSAHQDWHNRPFSLIPDLVVEVVSPDDTAGELDDKVDAYLADGVRRVWVLKPQRRSAIVYAPNLEQPVFLAGDALLDGGEVIPGFKLALSKLFESF